MADQPELALTPPPPESWAKWSAAHARLKARLRRVELAGLALDSAIVNSMAVGDVNPDGTTTDALGEAMLALRRAIASKGADCG
jgi:hypothetical protein